VRGAHPPAGCWRDLTEELLLVTGDLSGDGKPDIVVGNWHGRPHAYINDGKGGFAAVPFGDDAGAAHGLDIADFDGDGLADIGMARSDAPNMVYTG